MTDSRGNEYRNVNNARVTRVEHQKWAESKVLRFQAYRGTNLHMGAEIPIESPQDALDLIQAITELINK
jgi:hypothetical protein